MIRAARHILHLPALAVVLGLSVTVSACGGSSKMPGSANAAAKGSANVVAQVGSTPISKATFDHWMAIAVAIRNPPAPGQAPVRPTVPDPPSFKLCIASRRERNPKTKFTTGQLESACRDEYEELEPRVLDLLISAYWRRGEAEAQGIVVTDAEAQQELAAEVKRQYPKPGEFQTFLADSDQTTADVLVATKSLLIGEKLEHKAAAGHANGRAARSAMDAFARTYEKKWKSRTSCSPGFVGPDCREHS